MILQLYTNDFVAPFVKRCKHYRKRTIKKRKKLGIYLIRQNGIIVYVGMSQSCVTEALYRHFYYYNDTHRKPRTYYNIDGSNTYSVYVIHCTKEDAPRLERGLVLGIQPRDNRDRFQKYLDALSVKNIEDHQAQVEPDYLKEDLPF